MAQPILLEIPPRDPKAELLARLEAAPKSHAEAILAAFEVLQALHDRGVLEIVRGGLGSSDQVLEIAVDALKSPDSIRSLRNLLVVVNMLGSIDPAALGAIAKTVPPALSAMSAPSKPPGLWSLATTFLRDRDVRLGLSAALAVLKAMGSGLAREKEAHP